MGTFYRVFSCMGITGDVVQLLGKIGVVMAFSAVTLPMVFATSSGVMVLTWVAGVVTVAARQN